MKIIINSKNFSASDKLKETIDKKFGKLDKYFSNDITANVMTLKQRDRYKVEATINTKGTIFRAEDLADDPYEGVDNVVEKLSRQMSKFKTKLQKKYKDHKDFTFANLPEVEDEREEVKIVRTKRFELVPMEVEEAAIQMELLQHNFFVFLNIQTDSVNVVYQRDDDTYGLLETNY
ncbi:MAG: ribosome-associated translation inhibitor RaiA [Anaerovoracaceae bacterium]